ncbi:hypothetical protein M8J77_017025 [Diaphorina citri]|nr:hypothetical protein M8J77_017025 [Diaphorina citri]
MTPFYLTTEPSDVETTSVKTKKPKKSPDYYQARYFTRSSVLEANSSSSSASSSPSSLSSPPRTEWWKNVAYATRTTQSFIYIFNTNSTTSPPFDESSTARLYVVLPTNTVRPFTPRTTPGLFSSTYPDAWGPFVRSTPARYRHLRKTIPPFVKPLQGIVLTPRREIIPLNEILAHDKRFDCEFPPDDGDTQLPNKTTYHIGSIN